MAQPVARTYTEAELMKAVADERALAAEALQATVAAAVAAALPAAVAAALPAAVAAALPAAVAAALPAAVAAALPAAVAAALPAAIEDDRVRARTLAHHLHTMEAESMRRMQAEANRLLDS